MISAGIVGAVYPSDAANFLNQMETLVTLTGLELTLARLSGKPVYTCTICKDVRWEDSHIYCFVSTNSNVFCAIINLLIINVLIIMVHINSTQFPIGWFLWLKQINVEVTEIEHVLGVRCLHQNGRCSQRCSQPL